MMMKLSQEERDRIMGCLNEPQVQFLHEQLKRGKRTVFANVMARQKGAVIPLEADFEQVEHLLSEWVYTGYIDAGYVSPHLRCECGRPLRKQHIVEHKSTGQIKKFGINHLQDHLGLDPKTVQEIVQGFDMIDYELDEILLKIEQQWELRLPPFQHLTIPADIQQHLDLNLPLLDRQVNRLRNIIQDDMAYGARQARQARLASLESRLGIMETGRTGQIEHTDQVEETGQIEQIEFASLTSIDHDERTTDRETEVQVEWSLGLGAVKAEEEELSAPTPTLELDASLQLAVLEYLQQGIRSTRIICELLIENHRAYKKRYLSGKPYVYVSVCGYMDSLVTDGRCVLQDKAMDRSDRLYQWLD